MSDHIISIAEELRALRPERPSLLEAPFFDAGKATQTQIAARDFILSRSGKTATLLWLGGKGSGKSYFASLALAEMAIQNPNSISAMIANTKTQIADTPLPYVIDRLKSAGIDATTRTEVTIGGKRFKQVILVKLGDDLYSYIAIRSFENIDMIEGAEYDAIWVDEVQDTSESGIKVVISRLRGKRNRCPYLPQRLLICTGLVSWNYDYHWTAKSGWFDKKLFSTTEENIRNLPEDYISNLRQIYTPEEIEMFLYGRVVRKVEYRAVFDFDYERNVLKAAEDAVDPKSVVISVDFNAAPMCASVFSFQFGRWVCVDEIELWGATTYDLAGEINERGYGGVIIGDASGNRRDTRGEMSDFDILESMCPQFEIMRGLVWRGHARTKRAYSNPPVRDTVHMTNKMLRGRELVFNPSKLESGGVPASLAAAVWDPAGRAIDKRGDRSHNVRAPRTHFADTVRYFAYYVQNYYGISAPIYDDDIYDTDIRDLLL